MHTTWPTVYAKCCDTLRPTTHACPTSSPATRSHTQTITSLTVTPPVDIAVPGPSAITCPIHTHMIAAYSYPHHSFTAPEPTIEELCPIVPNTLLTSSARCTRVDHLLHRDSISTYTGTSTMRNTRPPTHRIRHTIAPKFEIHTIYTHTDRKWRCGVGNAVHAIASCDTCIQ